MWKGVYLIVCLVTLFAVENVKGQGSLSPSRRVEQDLLDNLLGQDYDPRINPGGNASSSQPTLVTINMYVRHVRDISTNNMDFKVQLTFRCQWKDNRLSYKVPSSRPELKYLTLQEKSKIWTPDIFISNEKESRVHDFAHPNQYFRIFPNGEVLWSQRVSLTLNCPMVLRDYPFDQQVCHIRLASWGYTTSDTIFEWKAVDPIQVTSELHLPHFSLNKFKPDRCDSQTITGVYSCLRVDFVFRRESAYYITQVFIPTAMLVILSWFAFWLDTKSSLVARMALALFSLGLMVIIVHQVGLSAPPISYTKAMDKWTGSCITFVFLVVVETVIAYYLNRESGRGCGESSLPKLEVEGGGNLKSRIQAIWSNVGNCGQKLDVVMLIIYPLAFIILVLAFYGAYSSHVNWEEDNPAWVIVPEH